MELSMHKDSFCSPAGNLLQKDDGMFKQRLNTMSKITPEEAKYKEIHEGLC